jgi:hypothetical protein
MSTVDVNCNDVNYKNPGDYCKDYQVKITGDNRKDCASSIKLGVCQSKVSDCILSQNAKIRQTYNLMLNKARDERARAKQAQNDWDLQYTKNKQELIDERRVWNTCVLWTGVYWHHDWCQNDTGFGQQVGAGGYGCLGGQGKGQCARTEQQVNNELNKLPPRPLDGPQDPKEPSYAQTFPLAAINCCNNTVNIINGEVKNTTITQQCISKSTNSTTTSKPSTTATPPPTPTPTPTPSTSLISSTSTDLIQDNKTIIISIIIASVCIMSSIIILLFII